MKGLNLSGLEDILENHQSKNYALLGDQNERIIHIIIRENCSSQEMLESYYNAVMSAMIITGKVRKQNWNFEIKMNNQHYVSDFLARLQTPK